MEKFLLKVAIQITVSLSGLKSPPMSEFHTRRYAHRPSFPSSYSIRFLFEPTPNMAWSIRVIHQLMESLLLS